MKKREPKPGEVWVYGCQTVLVYEENGVLKNLLLWHVGPVCTGGVDGKDLRSGLMSNNSYVCTLPIDAIRTIAKNKGLL